MAFGRRFDIPTNSFLHRFLLRRRGKRDGRAGIPRANEPTPSEQERQLLARCQQHMARIAADYSRAIRDAEASLTSQIELFKTLLTAFKDESLRYDARRGELNRNVVNVHIGGTWYRILLVLIGIGEFALNAQAFEVFQKPLLLTWLMALTLAVGIPSVAHFCGIWIRQWPKPAWVTALKLCLTFAGSIACLVGINFARQAYLASQQLTSGPQSELLEQAFLAINIFVFLTATILSHFSHDPDYELEVLHRRVSKLDRKLDAVDSRIYKHEGALKRMRVRQRAELEEIRAIILELVFIYREANRLARGGEEVSVFKEAPRIDYPDCVVGLTDELKDQVGELRRSRYEARSGVAAAKERIA